MAWFESWRTRTLRPIGLFLLRQGVTANILTSGSLVAGILAIFFLFQNHLLFVIFSLLHLLIDALDGVVARLSKETKLGKYFDYFSDRLVTFLALVKIGWVLEEYYSYLALGLYVLAQSGYVLSKFKAPILFTRTLVLILLFLNWPVLAYLSTGIAAVYSLLMQAGYWGSKFKRKSL